MRVRQAEVVQKSDDDELASLNAVECEGVQLRNAYPASDILSLCAHYLAKTVHAFVSFSTHTSWLPHKILDAARPLR